MNKRRHSITEADNEPAKRLNLGNHIDDVNHAIDRLIEGCTEDRSIDNAIAQSTTALTKLKEKSAPLLIMRANALANKAKFGQAIEDAMKAIKCQPKAKEGYIAAASIYSMQGKEQAATYILDAGLHVVPPSDHQLLYEKRDGTKDLLDRKVDFVARLPTEITSAVIDYLQSEYDRTLVNCAMVSKRWRGAIMDQCVEAWRAVTLDNRYIQFNPAAILLPVISNHIQKLTLRRLTSENALLERLVDMAAKNKFPSINSITLVTSTSLLLEYHVALITIFRDNLTKIDIDIIEFEDGSDFEDNLVQARFSLNLILSLCPHLQHLIFKTDHDVAYHPLQPSTTGGYALVTLAIGVPQTQTERILERLIPFCPKLQVLNVDNLSPNIINLIHHQLPRLRYLKTFDDHPVELKAGNAEAPPGLYDLDCDIINADQLQSMMLVLLASKRTLKSLKLFLRHPEFINGINQLSILGFDVLKNLDFLVTTRSQYFSDNIANSIIHQCPLLESVSLNLGSSEVSEKFYNCLTVQTQIRFMDISRVNSPSAGLELFLDKLAERGESCTLQEIILGGQPVTDGVLGALTDIATLQKITLKQCPALSAHGVAVFVRKLQTLSHLIGVSLECIPFVTDDIAIQLAKVAGLQFVSLSGLQLITSYGARFIADQARNLKHALFSSCPGVDYESIEYIDRKFFRR